MILQKHLLFSACAIERKNINQKITLLKTVRLCILLILALVASVESAEASRKILVEVIDSVSGEPVPYTAIYVRGTSQGILADDDGKAKLAINTPKAELEFSAMGYDKKITPVSQSVAAMRVLLSPSGHQLDEVVVKRRKEHYSKRNNPAVDFMQRIRNADSITDPRRHDYFNFTRYERITLGMNKVEVADTLDSHGNRKKKGKFDFLREHVDTSAVTGLPVLPLSVKEKVTDVIYRRAPRSEKEYVLGVSTVGVDELIDQRSMQTLVEDVFREIDLYNNDINILQNRFVSPLSRIAPDFYKFYLTDTIPQPDGSRWIELSFAPRNPASFGFTGRLYVAEGDSTMFVRRVRMNVPPSINLNFVEHLQIEQEFERAPNGARLKTLDDFNLEASFIPGTPGAYIHRTTAYDNFSFDPSPRAELFDRIGNRFSDVAAYARDDSFWDDARLVKVSKNEGRVAQLMTKLRGVKAYYYTEKFLKIMFSGYVKTAKNSKIDIGPVNTFISGNSVEGLRLRFGGVTTAELSPHWFMKGYGAYGFRDKKWKYGATLEYSFKEKREHPNEFPIHSIAVSEKYDVDQVGQHYLFTNPDNMFLSWKRMKNLLMTYRRQTRIDYTLELANNFSVRASANFERQEATPWVPFIDGFGRSVGHYNETYFTLELRYAPGEKFFQTRSLRIPVNFDAPVIVLTHTFAPKHFMGAPFQVNKTELSFSKRFWLSAFGFVDCIIKGGHVWSQSPYLSLLIPNANLSYTIQPESFGLMTPLEFIHDSFGMWDITYWANGAILNNIPLLKKLKLREAVTFRGWIGNLSDRNNPLKHPELYRFPVDIPHISEAHNPYQSMHGKPYMEISAGIDNLFKCLRVDWVWRLTYREGIPASSKSGPRIALHMTF